MRKLKDIRERAEETQGLFEDVPLMDDAIKDREHLLELVEEIHLFIEKLESILISEFTGTQGWVGEGKEWGPKTLALLAKIK